MEYLDIEQMKKHIDELAEKVSELEQKIEHARLYGFSRNSDDD